MNKRSTVPQRSPSSRPAVVRCVALFSKRIQNGDWPYGSRLPSIASLAVWSEASQATVWRALREMSAQGMVAIVQGRGTFVGAPPSPVSPPRASTTGSRWARLAHRLEHDLLTGVIPAGNRLPGTTDLASTHGLDPRTVRRALDYLERKGLLERRRRVYHAAQPSSQAGATLAFMTNQNLREISSTAFATLSMSSFVRSLERSCAERNVRLAPLVSDDRDALRRLHARRTVLGHIVYCPGDTSVKVADAVAPFGRPICVFEYPYRMGPDLSPERLTSDGAILFHIDDRRAGADVGRFLVRTYPTRHVAFVSPFHAEPFSRDRLAGLHDAYSTAGRSREVAVHAADEVKRDLYRAFLSRSAHGPFRRSGRPDRSLRQNRCVAVLDEYFGPGEMDWLMQAPVWGAQFERLYADALWEKLVPLFDTATKGRQPAVWVCVSDVVAIAALRYLATAGIRVPQQCAVVGFDNTPEATYHGLSSYDFDTVGIGRRMLQHVIQPPTVGAIVACGGSMVER